MHAPVMVAEVIRGLAPASGRCYIDATLGAGGHAQAILDASAPYGRLLALDCDPDAAGRARQRLHDYRHRLVIAIASFTTIASEAARHGFVPCHGILFDLGLSSDQLADARRGFSFAADGPLDMRFDPRLRITASQLVNGLDEDALANLIYRYGEERRSRRIARAIVAARPLHSTLPLAATIAAAAGHGGRLHPARRTFQALRIAVNDELGALQQALPLALELLAGGGRLVVLSYHSLEDRIVKQLMRDAARDCLCPPEAPHCRCGHAATVRVLTKHPIRPSDDEVQSNPRARSARLRIAERLGPAVAPGEAP